MKKFRVAWFSLFVLLLLVLFHPPASDARAPSAPGDENWDDEFYLAGPDAPVNTLSFYNNELIAGGDFHTAGKTVTNHIARWNGTEWAAIGAPPLSGYCPYHCNMTGQVLRVNTSIIHNGKLFVGGAFHNGIVEWDGSGWDLPGGGLQADEYSPWAPCLLSVNALAEMGNDLYVAGCFYKPGTTTQTNILRWDGSTWSELNVGVQQGAVKALAVHGDDLYVGGDYLQAGDARINNIARWNRLTGEWSSLGAGPPGNRAVYAMTFVGDTLVVVAKFTGEEHWQLMTWDGSKWSMWVEFTDPSDGIGSLASHNNELYVFGHFTTFAGYPIQNIAIWDGTNWHGLAKQHTNGNINTIAWNADGLYVGGDFQEVDGKQALEVAKWDESEWSALATPGAQGVIGNIQTMVIYKRDVFIGGTFHWVGTQRANGLAKWNTLTHTWTPLGNAGCVTSECPLDVRTMTFNGQELYVGGAFGEIGYVRARNLAKWDGTKWSPVPGWHGQVPTALTVNQNNLYTASLEQKVREWDGVQWRTLGKFDNPTQQTTVSALEFFKDNLFVAGNFDSVDGQPVLNVARWDGALWHNPGMGLNSSVYALSSSPKQFLAAAEQAVYSWTGTRWRRLGKGYGYVRNVTQSGRTIYRSGVSLDQGTPDTSPHGIAEWRDGKWQTLGSGIALDPLQVFSEGGIANNVAVIGSHVFITGGFDIVGEKPSNNFAMWSNNIP